MSTIHTNIIKANNDLKTVMVNNSHQRQQSEQSHPSIDGQQFTPISTKRTNFLNSDGQQSHQYQQSEQSSPNTDG
jgi:hypothetical protein